MDGAYNLGWTRPGGRLASYIIWQHQRCASRRGTDPSILGDLSLEGGQR